jgi:hypothetical protein
MTRLRAHVVSAAAAGLLLTGCSEVGSALDTASDATDKASACTEALGLVTSFDPSKLEPEQIQEQAGQQAQRLQELSQQVSDADLRQNLLDMANSYVELEQRQADALGDVTDWVAQQTEDLNQLREVCL